MIATPLRPKLYTKWGDPLLFLVILVLDQLLQTLYLEFFHQAYFSWMVSACKGMIYCFPFKVLCPTFATAIFCRQNQMSPLFSFTTIQQKDNKCIIQPFLSWFLGVDFSPPKQTQHRLTKNFAKAFQMMRYR